MLEAAERGRELEDRVAAHLDAHGYRVRRNVVVVGRSGARHEVDVLAEKVDSLTTYRVAVECKAWRVPVGQDVVSKLAWVMSDLGLHKGIVVSLAGAERGAAQAAAGLGIEIWGDGQGGGSRGGVPGPLRPGSAVLGPPLRVGPELARRVVGRARVGRLGPGREVVVASALAWVPAHELCLALTQSHGRIRPHTAVTRSWNCYEALTGTLIAVGTAPGDFAEQDAGPRALPALVGDVRVAGDLRRAMSRLAGVATAAATARHAAALGALGVAEAPEHLEVEESRMVHLPFYLALLRRRHCERIVAVDGRSGRPDPVVAGAATATSGQVVEALGWPRSR